jgi:hypothetical protein
VELVAAILPVPVRTDTSTQSPTWASWTVPDPSIDIGVVAGVPVVPQGAPRSTISPEEPVVNLDAL